jgi:hypothetical protein
MAASQNEDIVISKPIHWQKLMKFATCKKYSAQCNVSSTIWEQILTHKQNIPQGLQHI